MLLLPHILHNIEYTAPRHSISKTWYLTFIVSFLIWQVTLHTAICTQDLCKLFRHYITTMTLIISNIYQGLNQLPV